MLSPFGEVNSSMKGSSMTTISVLAWISRKCRARSGSPRHRSLPLIRMTASGVKYREKDSAVKPSFCLYAAFHHTNIAAKGSRAGAGSRAAAGSGPIAGALVSTRTARLETGVSVTAAMARPMIVHVKNRLRCILCIPWICPSLERVQYSRPPPFLAMTLHGRFVALSATSVSFPPQGRRQMSADGKKDDNDGQRHDVAHQAAPQVEGQTASHA